MTLSLARQALDLGPPCCPQSALVCLRARRFFFADVSHCLSLARALRGPTGDFEKVH